MSKMSWRIYLLNILVSIVLISCKNNNKNYEISTKFNLFDKRYYNAPFDSNFSAFDNAPQLGRLVYATLSYKF